MSKREFRLENEYPYNRSGPVRWILSHMWRYWYFPLIGLVAVVLNNVFYSSIQVTIGRVFDLIITPGWSTRALL